MVEDVLLNRCENSTERMLEYAATLDPKCKPTAVRKLHEQPAGPVLSPKLNPIPADADPLAPPADLPPVPVYKPWVDALEKTPAFAALEALMTERVIYIDGAMGTQIQKYKLQEADYRGERWAAHLHELKGNNDLLVVTRPDVIEAIHTAYLEGGADIIETNTFNGTTTSQVGPGGLRHAGLTVCSLLAVRWPSSQPARCLGCSFTACAASDATASLHLLRRPTTTWTAWRRSTSSTSPLRSWPRSAPPPTWPSTRASRSLWRAPLAPPARR
jgi:hypothetical protein